MKKREIIILAFMSILIGVSVNVNSTTNTMFQASESMLHSKCRGLRPVYDNSGVLRGYRGFCKVKQWNGSTPMINTMHPLDPNIFGMVPQPQPQPRLPLNTNVLNQNRIRLNQNQIHGIDQEQVNRIILRNQQEENNNRMLEHHNHHSHHQIHHSPIAQPAVPSMFDFMSPTSPLEEGYHNHPHFRTAHLEHQHCIHKKTSGIWDFITELFGGSHHQNHHLHHHRDEYEDDQGDDPYDQIEEDQHCLDQQHYQHNPFSNDYDNEDEDGGFEDGYSRRLAHRIHHIHNQMDFSRAAAPYHPFHQQNYQNLTRSLHDHYDRLHRHLDCHCHHELENSHSFGIHHRPIDSNSLEMLADPDPMEDSMYPIKLHMSLPYDPEMDLENEKMALMRMSSFATQQAHNRGYFNNNNPAMGGVYALRMQMYQPVNPMYNQMQMQMLMRANQQRQMMNMRMNMLRYQFMNQRMNQMRLMSMNQQQQKQHQPGEYDDPEFNKLRVEKIIVIKRIKVPVEKRIPVPVPMPYPVPNLNGSESGGASSSVSSLASMKSGYIGENRYLVDSKDTAPINMNSIMHRTSSTINSSPYLQNQMMMSPLLSQQQQQFIIRTQTPGLQLNPNPGLYYLPVVTKSRKNLKKRKFKLF